MLKIALYVSCLLWCAACSDVAGEQAASAAATLTSAEQAPAAPKPNEAPSADQPTQDSTPKPATEPHAAQKPGAGEPSVEAKQQCAGICSRSTELKCAQAAQCETMCLQSMVDATCTEQMAVATGCMLKHPASSWECTEDGVAAIKDGLCDKEQGAFADCLMAHEASHH